LSGTAIDLEGRVVARPRDGLVAYRIPAGARVRSLAKGLAPDEWSGARLTYRVWPARSGTYELTLSVPPGTPPRTVHVGARTLTISARAPRRLSIRTAGEPLRLLVDVPAAPLGGRVLGVKVLALRFRQA